MNGLISGALGIAFQYAELDLLPWPLDGHIFKVGLCVAQAAADLFADVDALLGLRIAADVNADRPHLRSAVDDLANLSNHIASK